MIKVILMPLFMWSRLLHNINSPTEIPIKVLVVCSSIQCKQQSLVPTDNEKRGSTSILIKSIRVFSFASLNSCFSFFTRLLIVHFKICFSPVRSKWILYCGNQERFSMQLQSLCCFTECSIYNVWSFVYHWNNETDTRCNIQIEKNAFQSYGTDNNMLSSSE